MKNEKEFVEHLNNNMPTEEKNVMLQKELDLLCQAGVEHLLCIRKHWEVNKTNVSELNAIAQCMFQMIWLKAKRFYNWLVVSKSTMMEEHKL